MCVFVYIHTHTRILNNMETLVGQKKKTWDSSECCVPRKSFRVPFWTRVPKVRQPFSSTSVFPLRMVSSHSIFTSSACPSYHKEKRVKPGNLWTLRLSWTSAELVRTAQCVCVIKTSQLLWHREIIAVCSQVHTKHINTLCGQNVEFVNVKPGGTYSNHWTLKGK